MNEDIVKNFDRFFVEKYQYLQGFTKSINPRHEYLDTLHDSYIRARTRINENGYSGQSFLNYFRVVIINYYKSQYRNDKSRELVDIENPDYNQTIEDILSIKEDQLLQEIENNNRNTFLTSSIYEYLNKYYDQRDQFIFKTYFLLKHKHLNYKQLSEATGFSITAVSNTIKKIKKDLRINLKCYILNGINMEELLKEVQNLLQQAINRNNYCDYLKIYKKIYNTDYRGCSCKRQKLMDEIINWFNQNKQ